MTTTTPATPARQIPGRTVGSVVAIYTVPAASVPMISQHEAKLIAGVGIEGDRYVRREGGVPEGHWKDRKWADQELTFCEVEKAEAFGVDPALTRRNIMTRGVVLADLIGKRFRVGEALIEGIRPCAPCNYVEGLSGKPGMRAALGDGGLRAKIVQGGIVRPGDTLVLIED